LARKFARRAMIGTTFAMLAGAAVAQPVRGRGPQGGGRGPGLGPGGAWNTASYLESLKSQLGITSAEEAAWTEYADTVRGVGEQLQGVHQIMFEAMDTASWQERRDMMNQMFQARQQGFEIVNEAAIKLLPAVSPTQRAEAQRLLPGLGYRRGRIGGPAGGRR